MNHLLLKLPKAALFNATNCATSGYPSSSLLFLKIVTYG